MKITRCPLCQWEVADIKDEESRFPGRGLRVAFVLHLYEEMDLAYGYSGFPCPVCGLESSCGYPWVDHCTSHSDAEIEKACALYLLGRSV